MSRIIQSNPDEATIIQLQNSYNFEINMQKRNTMSIHMNDFFYNLEEIYCHYGFLTINKPAKNLFLLVDYIYNGKNFAIHKDLSKDYEILPGIIRDIFNIFTIQGIATEFDKKLKLLFDYVENQNENDNNSPEEEIVLKDLKYFYDLTILCMPILQDFFEEIKNTFHDQSILDKKELSKQLYQKCFDSLVTELKKYNADSSETDEDDFTLVDNVDSFQVDEDDFTLVHNADSSETDEDDSVSKDHVNPNSNQNPVISKNFLSLIFSWIKKIFFSFFNFFKKLFK